jgi:hypothetical protein
MHWTTIHTNLGLDGANRTRPYHFLGVGGELGGHPEPPPPLKLCVILSNYIEMIH